MPEISNIFLEAISQESDKQENITENEWKKIQNNKEKDKILSSISDTSKKNEFSKKYENLKLEFDEAGEQIHKTTDYELKFFKEILNIKEETKSLDLGGLSDYFNISDKNKLNKLAGKLEKAGLKPAIFLSNYKNHIETRLSGLKNIENGGEYLEKIKKSIGNKFLNLETEFKTLESKILEGKTIYDYKWDMDNIVQDSFNSINTELFPSVELLIKAGGEIDQRKGSGAWVQNDKLEETLKMLDADILKNGDFDKTFLSGEIIDANTNTWNTFDTDGVIEGSTDSAILGAEGIHALKETSLLSEADKKLEAEATAAIIGYILAMLVPVAGDIASLPADTQDLIGTQDGLISVLKQSGQIPENYNRVNHLTDRILGGVGLIASIAILIGAGVALNKVIKSGKLSKYINRLKKLGIKNPEKMLENSFNDAKKVLGNGENKKVKKTIGNIHNISKGENIDLKYEKYDLVINGKGISFGNENIIEYNGYLLERGVSNSLIIKKINGEKIKGFDFIFSEKGKNIDIDGLNFYRPDKMVEKSGDYTYVKLSDENTQKMKDYSKLYSSSYSDIAKETGLFEIGKYIDAVGITNDKGGLNSILGIMMSHKGIASQYSGGLTDGGKGGGFFKDTFSGLHGPYFIVKNGGDKNNYNYLFPNEEGIEILTNSLKELKNAGKIEQSEVESILNRSYSYHSFVKYKKNITKEPNSDKIN